jgi:hypothetical protein
MDQLRYYQEEAIETVLSKIDAGDKRILLVMATGTGKSLVVAHILKRLSDEGLIKRALIVTDRIVLQEQWFEILRRIFSPELVSTISTNFTQRNTVTVTTYQALLRSTPSIDPDQDDNSQDYFSHIIIDTLLNLSKEFVSVLLDQFPNAVQIAVVNFPTNDYLAYFGQPAYLYSLSNAVQDGYRAAEDKPSLPGRDLLSDEEDFVVVKNPQDPITGKELTDQELRNRYTIFINYRRDDTRFYVDKLYSRLTKRFGRDKVFKDTSSIELGDNFVRAIEAAVGQCLVVLAVIGKQWLTANDSENRRRIDNPEDYLRRELETALDQKIKIIPILVQKATMPSSLDLPKSLELLSVLQAFEIVDKDKYFNQEVNDLVKMLERILVQEARKLFS